MNTFEISSKMSASEINKLKMQTETINKSITNNGKVLKQSLDKDDFLKLLLTELKHQDPSNPMQDREFIAQMAQFSAMEQMLNMNKSLDNLVSKFDFSGSFNLLGKNVEITTYNGINNDVTVVTGEVKSITKAGNDILVNVNNKTYSLSEVTKVF